MLFRDLFLISSKWTLKCQGIALLHEKVSSGVFSSDSPCKVSALDEGCGGDIRIPLGSILNIRIPSGGISNIRTPLGGIFNIRIPLGGVSNI